jgi:hypothetical protein
MTDENGSLFPEEEMTPWLNEWQGMPEYDIRSLAPEYQIIVKFACLADVEDFFKVVGQSFPMRKDRRVLPGMWYPPHEIGRYANKRYVSVEDDGLDRL